jgi:hypothetical protein
VSRARVWGFGGRGLTVVILSCRYSFLSLFFPVVILSCRYSFLSLRSCCRCALLSLYLLTDLRKGVVETEQIKKLTPAAGTAVTDTA